MVTMLDTLLTAKLKYSQIQCFLFFLNNKDFVTGEKRIEI